MDRHKLKLQLSFACCIMTSKSHRCLNTLHQTLGEEFTSCWGHVEELLAAGELWNNHNKLIFFHIASAPGLHKPSTWSQPKDRPLSLLVEVLPRGALCLFWVTVVLPLWFEVCRLVGLRSGEILPGRLLVLSVEEPS
ncbi:hypothetical protein Taro_034648 [Colocasia esculenta]|uniref:Uncharacterized protein n=1 Tax=Colocasia esculenta TaxID=4460 RepID=A0A843WCI4_COLES|nr:hypothetical protein [Colocasia esculenta]